MATTPRQVAEILGLWYRSSVKQTQIQQVYGSKTPPLRDVPDPLVVSLLETSLFYLGILVMLKHGGIRCILFIVALSGCATSSTVEEPPRVHDIHISGQDSITPVELYAAVGEEIRWHNGLSTPIYLGFLGVKPMKEAGCEKGFKTWYGEMKDLVTIRAGEYVSLCPTRTGTVWYNIWTDMEDPVRSMSTTAVIHLEEAA